MVSRGGRGIGRAVALLLAEERASVAAEIKRAGGKAVASYEDVSLMEGGERVVQQAVDAGRAFAADA